MQHAADTQVSLGRAAYPREIRPGHVKGIRHAHLLQDIAEFRAVLVLIFRDGGIHLQLGGVRQDVPGFLPVQGGHKFRHAHALLGQQRRIGIFPVRVIFQEPRGMFILQVLVLLGVHHLRLLDSAVLLREIPLPHFVVMVDPLPLRVESQRVHQVHHRVHGNLVQDFLNHALRIVLHPSVDFLQGGLVKRRPARAGPKGVFACLQELRLHGKALILREPDAVRHAQPVVLPCGQPSLIGSQERGQLWNRHSEDLLHLP